MKRFNELYESILKEGEFDDFEDVLSYYDPKVRKYDAEKYAEIIGKKIKKHLKREITDEEEAWCEEHYEYVRDNY